VTAVHTLLEQLQHILQNVDSGVEKIDALGDLEIGAGGCV
jgi:hypothetical protein